ncbi:hypothetical protein J1N09_00200 [Aureitalea sp. L0-47]|uniref:hypothetical protein n=1 Tax=Aureitalea sp. L0-47 TaxID=2816962 RepID=UPI002238DE3F|nr:hypothetical protein [Aureitalea sp. L0-47]MCW5518238.1 hypothetical protein [Aureitalea sp. L0-47]
MRSICALVFFGIVFSVYPQEEKVDPPQIAIKIQLGETITLDGTQITFSEVLEDSRCPREVQCVWAGSARVKITIALDRENASSRELIFGAIRQGETSNNLVAETDDFHYEAIGISPYPQVPGEELDYSLLVKKVKKEN